MAARQVLTATVPPVQPADPIRARSSVPDRTPGGRTPADTEAHRGEVGKRGPSAGAEGGPRVREMRPDPGSWGPPHAETAAPATQPPVSWPSRGCGGAAPARVPGR